MRPVQVPQHSHMAPLSHQYPIHINLPRTAAWYQQKQTQKTLKMEDCRFSLSIVIN